MHARRRWRIALALLWLTAVTPAGAEIVLAQVAPFSGPLARAGQEYHDGAMLYFRRVNESGGVHGERIRLTRRDDGYVPERTVALVNEALQQDRPLALLGLVGTQNMRALLEARLIEREQVPVVGISSGATMLRSPMHPLLFHLRASYRDEAARIARQFAVMGVKNLGVLYQDDALGADALVGLESAAASLGLAIVAKAAYRRNTSEIDAAVQTLAQASPQALVLLSNTPASIGFLKRYRTGERSATPVLALSITDASALGPALGPERARGIGVAQVVPSPLGRTHGLVRDFEIDLARHAPKGTEASHSLLEGYVAARVLAEALRRTGPGATRQRLIAALESMHEFDLGGFVVRFTPTRRDGSRFVDLSVIGDGGRLLN
ncbi:ABC transporter substrate-binding protein [Aquabacterium humicola]|uniref:ABC transporter substrate-binding protein n=1 Tax=Aquabacterium humicola TaxID=3237377 RepID=UPI00254321DB|nr:ABC transporter substrate-binding protein [Rubrivivax pictus]